MSEILITQGIEKSLLNSLIGRREERYKDTGISLTNSSTYIYIHQKGNDNEYIKDDYSSFLSIGRIFNKKELNFFGDLNTLLTNVIGQFLIVRQLNPNDSITISTDGVSGVSGFIYQENDKIVISSRLDILLSLFPNKKWEVNWENLLFCSYSRYPLGNKTIIKGIELLEYGTTYTMSNDGVRKDRYWIPDVKSEDDPNIVDKLCKELCSVLDRGTIEYSNPILSLSGGFDSRLVLAGLLKIGKRVNIGTWGSKKDNVWHIDNRISIDVAKSMKLPLFTFDQTGGISLFNDKKSREKLLLETNGCSRHSLFFMWCYRNGYTNLNKFDLELSGLGGELLKHSAYSRFIGSNEKINPKLLIKRTFQHYTKRHQKNMNNLRGPLSQVIKNLEKFSLDNSDVGSPDSITDYDKLNYMWFYGWNQQYYWSRLSFMSKYFSIFYSTFNIKFMDLCFRLTPEYRNDNNTHRLMIKKLYPKLLDFPFTSRVDKNEKVNIYKPADPDQLMRPVFTRSSHVLKDIKDIFPKLFGNVDKLSNIYKFKDNSTGSRLCGSLEYLTLLSKHGVQFKEV